MGCCFELSLGKGDTLSGPQPLSPGMGSPSRGSTAAQARGRELPPTAQELQILSGPEPPEALEPAGMLTLPGKYSKDPFSGAGKGSRLRQRILVRKAGWGVQAGRGAGSSAKECLGIPGPALCQKLALAQLHESSLTPRSELRRTGPAMCNWPCGTLGASVKEPADAHTTRLESPQELGTQSSSSEEQGMSEQRGPAPTQYFTLKPAGPCSHRPQRPRQEKPMSKDTLSLLPSPSTRGTSSFLSQPGHSSQSY